MRIILHSAYGPCDDQRNGCGGRRLIIVPNFKLPRRNVAAVTNVDR